jgi:hypothetical protein
MIFASFTLKNGNVLTIPKLIRPDVSRSPSPHFPLHLWERNKKVRGWLDSGFGRNGCDDVFVTIPLFFFNICFRLTHLAKIDIRWKR